MQRFKNIICVIVPGLKSQDILERAVNLTINNQAKLTLIQVIDDMPLTGKLLAKALSPEDIHEKMIIEYQRQLEELITPWKNSVNIEIKVLSGTPFLEIIEEVLRNDRDLVIKPSECGELLDRVFGSNDMHLLRKCPCPVWLIKPEAPLALQRIVVAVDASSDSSSDKFHVQHLVNLQVLEMASSLALPELAEVDVVYAWHAVGESAMRGGFITKPEDEIIKYVEEARQHENQNLNSLINELEGKLGQNTLEYIKPQTHLLKGWPRDEIPAFAKKIKADLVVMGTVARTGIPGFFMGNTAETILNKLDCSVLAIKPSDFKTPVTIKG